MKGKLLENIVLTIGLLVLSAAVFLMYFAKTPELAQSVNLIFATGFVIYIIYNYIMARNLNGKIYDLEKHVANLKEEIGRLETTLKKRNATIAKQKSTIAAQKETLAQEQEKITSLDAKLSKAKAEIARLSEELSKKEKA